MMEGGGGSGGSGEGGGGGGVTQFEVKALQAQNEKLRETLVSMRDLSAHEKHELSKLAKDLEDKVAQLAAKTKAGSPVSRRVGQMAVADGI
jgi:hypothetical protein